MANSFLREYNLKYKRILFRLIRDNVKSCSSCFILDVGCRWGGDLKRASELSTDNKLFGIDTELYPLQVAYERLVNIKGVYLLQAKAEFLPFQKEPFDIIYSSEVIEHMKNPEYFIKDRYRVLKQGTVFIITTPSRFNYVSLVGEAHSPFSKGLFKEVCILS